MELYLQHNTESDCKYKFKSPLDLNVIIEKYNLDLKDFDIFYNSNNNNNRIIDAELFDLFIIEDIEDVINFYESVLLLADYEKVPLIIFGKHYGSLDFYFDLDEIDSSISYHQLDCYSELAEFLYNEGDFEEVPNWMDEVMDEVYELLAGILEDDWNEVEVDSLTYFYKVH